MNSGTIITGTIILLICIIPIAWMVLHARKRERKLLQGLSEIAERNNCKISRYELWNHSIIGMDDAAHMVFFTRKSGDKETSQHINLAEVRQCSVTDSSRTVSNKESSVMVIDRLALAFSFRDKTRNDITLEFYNADTDSLTLTGELQLVEKWCKIINDRISERETLQ